MGSLAAAAHPVLADHVRHPGIGQDLHHLDGTEPEVVGRAVAVPLPVGALRLGPAPGYRDDEALAPATQVVADVRDDLRAGGLRARRVPAHES